MTIAQRLKALEAKRASSNWTGWEAHQRELAGIRAEVEAVAKEMRGVENRVDRGHYTLGWADRLAKDGEDE